MTTIKARAEADRAEACAKLREWIKPGDQITTVLRHVSASGMSRSISLMIALPDRDGARPGPVDVSYWAARAMGDRLDPKHGGIKIGGGGMDMGFALVYALSSTLFADGFTCTGDAPRCPSNDHNNPPYPGRDGTMLHSDPGYALTHRWL